jgi:Flp pilus assembly protein TadG
VRRGVRAADERGAATAELVIATPALLLLLMFVIQVGLWFHASHIASSVAQEGARVGRNQGGTEVEAEAAANDLLERLGARLVHEPQVHVDIDPVTHLVVATVEGKGPEVIPGLRLPIHARSSGPTEEFRSPAEAP